jgi:hypothetical protein
MLHVRGGGRRGDVGAEVSGQRARRLQQRIKRGRRLEKNAASWPRRGRSRRRRAAGARTSAAAAAAIIVAAAAGAVAIAVDAADIIAQDTALLLAANQAQIGSPVANVNLATAGSPNVVRNAVTAADTAAFAAYNATRPRDQQRAAVGSVQSISESYLNAARRNLAGFDFLVGYRTPKTSFGTLRATVEASYLRQFDEKLSATSPVVDYGWRDGNTRWKGSASLQWKRADWTATWVSDYTGRTQDSFIRTTAATGPDISSDGFLIVRDSWLSKASVAREFTGKNWLGGTTVRFGVNNLFNAEPPFALGASSDTDGYLRGFGDPRGRAYYLEVSRKF